MFEEILSGIEKIITPANMIVVLKIAAIIIIGLLFLRLILFYVKRTMKKRFSQQSIMIVRKLLSYTALFIILILILKQLNVKLAAILGAAGIAGIAIGFASQTSLSNIISGVFLISEKAFTVGDIIKSTAYRESFSPLISFRSRSAPLTISMFAYPMKNL